ncbi:bacillithiol biosynthesis deacetylase BshB1 [Ammoniphilus sp. CFH 90114]|uniref:bacillithiol biosynthesis deacetylase BshB1 n=1 Tax=Ammoniphilus sp. CFH 90114 TaxID=2493665 RepID=UPI00100E072A|nr:bacillithiol biosynthesis deacetylase BshB1 [Ammoniphilus sp. CFH 90114]RXT13940.1 bacillithiol biosynthesis deacetylase BshB1 [Ammoniphilus sp. CFH 90114]
MFVDILAIGAHADDIEIGAGGTLYKHASIGQSIVLCDLTLAELSSNGDVETRIQEAEEARMRMGAKERLNLHIPDRGIEINPTQIKQLVEVIRKVKPTTILAPYSEDRHPDHEWCSRLVREAVFSAGIRKFAPEAGEAFKVAKVYHYFINDFVDPDLCVDVSDVYEQKLHILEAYKSQFMPSSGGVETPLTTGYFEQIRSREYLFGRKIGKGFAEGFTSAKPLSLDYLC